MVSIWDGLLPTEGAAIGAFGTGLVASFQKEFNFAKLLEVIESTALTSAMIFLVLLGAEFFNSLIALSQLPVFLVDLVTAANIEPIYILILILFLYLVLGCLMDSLAMILLTIPIFFPLIMTLDFGLTGEETAIWFGILTLIVVEVGLITPPVGLNVFIINKMAGDIPISQTFKGVLPVSCERSHSGIDTSSISVDNAFPNQIVSLESAISCSNKRDTFSYLRMAF